MIDFEVIGRLAYDIIAPALPIVAAAVVTILTTIFLYVTFKRW